MNNRIIIIILSSVIVILVAFGIIHDRRMRDFYSPDEPGGLRGKHRMMMDGSDPLGPGRRFCEPEFMREKLELSDDQISKISILNETFEKEYDRIFGETLPYREKFRDLLKQDNPDMKQVRIVLEKISNANVEIQLLRIKQGRTISSILTPEQNEKLKREHRMLRQGKGRGMGMGPDGL